MVVDSGNEQTTYADPSTIRRKGELVKMWRLFDYNTIQTKAGISFLSSKGQHEFDCAEERSRVLAYTWFSGNMGKGQAVYSNLDESKWAPIPPHSLVEALIEVACSKK
jgi:hypothetical protein